MANNKPTIFQKLSYVLGGNSGLTNLRNNVNVYNLKDSEVLFKTKDRAEYERKALELKQQKLLANQWRRAQLDLNNKSLAGLNEVKMMYRDADLMDTFPEIGAALDIVSEEATYIKNQSFMVNVSSKSERIKSILQDLLVNRLMINTMLPMICRSMCKYGNNFMLLNVTSDNGIIGWKQLPVYEIERYENGMENQYVGGFASISANTEEKKFDTTKFLWVEQTTYTTYPNWQIAHFRLLYDSLFLPYGVSFLHKARRHFRMLSMMEDMMLIYRLERSIERRVFKINVGAIDEADVPAYVQEIANNFKRTPVIDPQTGQLDLRKNLLNVSEDFFIPVRDENAANPIDTLQGAQNMTAMDDIKFVQDKVMTALRVPKSFLNFEEAQGDGKNLSLMDVRFTRTVNRIQQALLMELNKICVIHLYLLGFKDDLMNFSLTMNNPSSQAEMLEIENMAKKVTTAKDAMTDGGNGIPLMSATRAWKEIMGWSDKEIQDNLEELRLERALAAELEKTEQIIKRTKIFDPVDNIYGEIGAEYGDTGGGEEGGPDGGSGGGGFAGGGAFDPGLDDTAADDMGAEGEMGMNDAVGEEEAMGGGEPPEGGEEQPPMGETQMKRMLKNMLNEQKSMNNGKKRRKPNGGFADLLMKKITQEKRLEEQRTENIPILNNNFLINEDLNNIAKELDNITSNEEE